MISHITISMPSAPASRMIFEMRDARELLRVLGEVVEEGLVELAVDQAGARAAEIWCDMPPVPKITTRRSSG